MKRGSVYIKPWWICTLIGWLLLSSMTWAQEAPKTFDPDFKERYTGSKYNYEGKKVVTTRHENDGSYDTEYKSEKENRNSPISLDLGFMSWFFIILLIGGVIYIIFILSNEGGSGWFRSQGKTALTDHQVFHVETAQPNDFKAHIERAESEQDFRTAIRYYFLWTLKSMSIKQMIQIEDDKTNADYLNEIKDTRIQLAFSKILYLYNYTWYGEFAINTDQYQLAKQKFQSFVKTVS